MTRSAHRYRPRGEANDDDSSPDRQPPTVLEAMLADPMAGRLPYEHVVAMTDELLQSTASWLPQFAR